MDCPRCESNAVDLRERTDEAECRRCGHAWDLDTSESVPPPKPAKARPWLTYAEGIEDDPENGQ